MIDNNKNCEIQINSICTQKFFWLNKARPGCSSKVKHQLRNALIQEFKINSKISAMKIAVNVECAMKIAVNVECKKGILIFNYQHKLFKMLKTIGYHDQIVLKNPWSVRSIKLSN